jgi:hypothetical protein
MTSDIRFYLSRFFSMFSRICYQVDNTKALLQKSLPKQLPQEIHDVLKGFHKMRQGGLYKIRRILKENPTIAPESLHELEVFAYDDLYIKRKIQRGLDRLIGFREWHYRNLALQLATNYSTIYWESDLNIKALAENVNDKDAKLDPNFDKSKHYFIKNSMEYRHIAALGIFRLYLINACKKQDLRYTPLNQRILLHFAAFALNPLILRRN